MSEWFRLTAAETRALIERERERERETEKDRGRKTEREGQSIIHYNLKELFKIIIKVGSLPSGHTVIVIKT